MAWIAWSVMTALCLVNCFGVNGQAAFWDSLSTNLILAISVFSCFNILLYYHPERGRIWFAIGMILIFSFLVISAEKPILARIYPLRPDLWGNRALSVRWGFTLLVMAMASGLGLFWYEFLERNKSSQRREEIEKGSREAELFKLRQQLQPHFLFNSLNSINALIGTRPSEAREMVQQLSDFLRGTMKKEDQQSVSLEEELQYLQLYLAIEQVRFGNRLGTEVHTSEMAHHAFIPPMILQPVVENAIKFGLYGTREPVTISIRSQLNEQGELEVRVTNPFDPQSVPQHSGTGFGLSSIRRRLYLLFSRNDLLKTRADSGLFTATLIIPQFYDKDPADR